MKKEKKQKIVRNKCLKWYITTGLSLALVIAMIAANILTVSYEQVIHIAPGMTWSLFAAGRLPNSPLRKP